MYTLHITHTSALCGTCQLGLIERACGAEVFVSVMSRDLLQLGESGALGSLLDMTGMLGIKREIVCLCLCLTSVG